MALGSIVPPSCLQIVAEISGSGVSSGSSSDNSSHCGEIIRTPMEIRCEMKLHPLLLEHKAKEYKEREIPLLRGLGAGLVVANTLMLSWPEEKASEEFRSRVSVLLEAQGSDKKGCIDLADDIQIENAYNLVQYVRKCVPEIKGDDDDDDPIVKVFKWIEIWKSAHRRTSPSKTLSPLQHANAHFAIMVMRCGHDDDDEPHLCRSRIFFRQSHVLTSSMHPALQAEVESFHKVFL